jgi:phage-related protein
MSTFTWSPAPGPVLSVKPRVRTAPFGDGYQQRVGDGINTQPRSWSLQFTRQTSDVDAIDAFLSACDGVESFDWLPPSGLTGKWICADWSRSAVARQVQSITATFQEVFGD